MKAFQKDWALSPEGWHLPGHKETFNLETVLGDEVLREKYYQWVFYKEEWFNEHDIEQKYIVTFSLKYMDYQRTIRNEQIARAEKALSSKDKIERTRQSDFKRF
ncbi:MAG: transposase, partial [Oscillospiraceae bacterium]|nr:transposase [Oscillospiraceae bacterium]